MKMTLLELTQNILSGLNSEDINSIEDTLEGLQVANVIKDTFNAMVAAKEIPEHKELIKLTALSDSAFPTHFEFPTNTTRFEAIWYNVGASGTTSYRNIVFVEPLDFLSRTDNRTSDVTEVADKHAGTTLFIGNTKGPSFWTSFDDQYIVMDSHDSTIDATLQSSKVRAYGTMFPAFTIADDFVPDIDAEMFPLLLSEAKSVCFSEMKSQPDPKAEQRSRRLRGHLQNDMYRNKRKGFISGYGR